MVAEENKKHAILKKRIKRLGMHQVLIEKKSAEYRSQLQQRKKVERIGCFNAFLRFLIFFRKQ